jgi:uncharacterized protein YegL
MSRRRLPVYLLIDTSGSMRGSSIESVKVGLQSLLTSLRNDPFAIESVYLSLITFNIQANQLVPLTDLETFKLPDIYIPQSGPTFLGKALELLCRCYDEEIIKNTNEIKGDWNPLLFIMTDGRISDIGLYRELIPEVKKRKFAHIISCFVGLKSKDDRLKELSEIVLSLDVSDSNSFKQYFKWVSETINIGNKTIGTNIDSNIPSPPPEISIVI